VRPKSVKLMNSLNPFLMLRETKIRATTILPVARKLISAEMYTPRKFLRALKQLSD
jgi:hypothetical protein